MNVLQKLLTISLLFGATTAPVMCVESITQNKQKIVVASQEQKQPSRLDAARKTIEEKALSIKSYLLEHKKATVVTALVTIAYGIAFFNREKIFLNAAERECGWACDVIRYTLGLPQDINRFRPSKQPIVLFSSQNNVEMRMLYPDKNYCLVTQALLSKDVSKGAQDFIKRRYFNDCVPLRLQAIDPKRYSQIAIKGRKIP